MKKNKIFAAIISILLFIIKCTISYSAFKSVSQSNDNYIQIGQLINLNEDDYKCLVFKYEQDAPYGNKENWLSDIGLDKMNSILKGKQTLFPDIINVKSLKTTKRTSKILLLINSEDFFKKNGNMIKTNQSYVELTISPRKLRVPLKIVNSRSAPFTYKNGKLENYAKASSVTSILMDLKSYPYIGTLLGRCSFKVYINNNLYDQFEINFTR